MAAYGGDLIGTAARFGETTACRLAQAMRRALLREPGRVAPGAELLGKALAAVRLPGLRHQEGEIASRRGGVNDGPQLRKHRDGQHGSGLRLALTQHTVSKM